MYIYLTQNLINGKIYIGQSTKLVEESKLYYGSGVYFVKAIKKYGKKNFHKSIIIKNVETLSKLNNLEKFYISIFNSTDTSIGYNISPGGQNYFYKPLSSETKLKISKSLTGRKRTDAEKLSISIGQQMMSIEAKNSKSLKVSKALKGKKKSAEHTRKNKESYKVSGEEHHHTKNIAIYNEFDECKLESYGNFKLFCLENMLPYSAFKQSYQRNGERLYVDISLNYVNEENKKFKGWFALVLNKPT